MVPGSPFIDLFRSDKVMVNSLHGQGIEEPGPRVIIEGTAPDGTPEAIRIKDAPGFAMAVQWHPEYKATEDPVSRLLFAAFGTALRDWQRGLPPWLRSRGTRQKKIATLSFFLPQIKFSPFRSRLSNYPCVNIVT